MMSQEAERPDHPHRAERPLRQADADVLAAGGAGRRARRAARRCGRSSCSAKTSCCFATRQGRYGLIDRHCAHRGADLAFGRLETWRPALRLPWLAVRRRRPMPGDAGRAEGFEALPGHQAARLSGRGEERHPLGLSRRRRAAGLSRDRLLRRARQPHLRLQGPHRLQLAAGAGSRHRSGARLLPASLLRGRGHLGRLRQAVPRRFRRHRHADDQDAARIRPPDHQCRAHRIWPAADRAARDRRRAHPCARHQPALPARLRHPDEHGDDDHAVARAGRRRELLLVRDLHQPFRRRSTRRRCASSGSNSTSCPTTARARTEQTITASIRTSRRPRPIPAWAPTSTCTTSGRSSRWARSRTAPASISAQSDKAIVQYRRLLRQEIEKVAGGEKPFMFLDAAHARSIQGPATMDGIGPTRGWETYWMEVDVKRRRGAPWAAPVPRRSPDKVQHLTAAE